MDKFLLLIAIFSNRELLESFYLIWLNKLLIIFKQGHVQSHHMKDNSQ